MPRLHLSLLLLLAGVSRAGDCRFVSGPTGLCGFARLEPARGELRVGSTLRIRVNATGCEQGTACGDCSGRLRARWHSSAPEIATVDSTGLVRGERAGSADIRMEYDGAAASMHVLITP